MLRPDFAFIHTVQARAWLRQGMNGPEYAPPEKLNCRVNIKRRRAGAGIGQETLASGEIWFPAGVRLEPGSLIEFEGCTHSVLSCRVCYDFSGENHVEVEVG